MTDPELAADLAALRAMEPRARSLAELDAHLQTVGKMLSEFVHRESEIHEALGDPGGKLAWSELVERCRELHRAVHDPGIVGLRYHRKRLREDIERSKGGMQAGLGRITVDRGLLSTILDVLDDIEAAR